MLFFDCLSDKELKEIETVNSEEYGYLLLDLDTKTPDRNKWNHFNSFTFCMPSKLKVSFYGIWPEMKDYLQTKMRGFQTTVSTDKINEKNLNTDADILTVFVEAPVNKQIIEKMPNLKMIATMSTGFDHIDLDTAKKQKVPVCNVPTYGENTVAEHTMALMLAMARHVPQATQSIRQGHWD